MAKPTLKQILHYARADRTPPPPGPYEIALRCAAAILSSGKFGDDMTAPMQLAWRCVFPFYEGQKAYFEHAGLMFNMAHHASAPEGMSAAEVRAYITGGETGDMGESGFTSMAMAVQTISAEEAAVTQLRQNRIAECDQAMFAADAALHLARISNDPAKARRVTKAQAAWDAAAKAQSEAHSWTPTAAAVAEAVARAQH